ncbi:MAG TPA: ATP-binding cassette domain-containing protein, partial [Polyangiaceae bacterium]|nr:ATP-binding cassette domain-containing protein [Polyangiaceae bacterium]
MEPRLRVRAVSRSFGATRALSGVNLQAAAGEVHAVIGENGAGKSTLMRLLSGELCADEGTMELDGVPFAPKSPAEARARGVAIVSQELAVCPHMTVLENVMLGQEPTRFGLLDRPRMRRDAQRALEMLAGGVVPQGLDLDARLADLPTSGQQIVEIARALAASKGCRVLILDEPTSSLGKEDVARLFDVIRKLQRDGTTVLYVSHFLEEVASISQGYTVLRDGVT